jgi:hypothetical protein
MSCPNYGQQQLLGYLYVDLTTFCKGTRDDHVVFELDPAYSNNQSFVLDGSGIYYNGFSSLPSNGGRIRARVLAKDKYGRQDPQSALFTFTVRPCSCD